MPWTELQLPADGEMREFSSEFRGRARFLVDENAGDEVAEALKTMGFNTKTASELGLRGRDDNELFAAAWKRERIIITHDPDFLDDRTFPRHRNPGVVVIRPGSDGRNDEGLIRCLLLTARLVGENASWLRGKKVEFTSSETLTISSKEGKARYRWRRHSNPEIWEE